MALRPRYFEQNTLQSYIRNWWESLEGQRAWPAMTIWVAVTQAQRAQLEMAAQHGPIRPVKHKADPKDQFTVPEVSLPEGDSKP